MQTLGRRGSGAARLRKYSNYGGVVVVDEVGLTLTRVEHPSMRSRANVSCPWSLLLPLSLGWALSSERHFLPRRALLCLWYVHIFTTFHSGAPREGWWDVRRRAQRPRRRQRVQRRYPKRPPPGWLHRHPATVCAHVVCTICRTKIGRAGE